MCGALALDGAAAEAELVGTLCLEHSCAGAADSTELGRTCNHRLSSVDGDDHVGTVGTDARRSVRLQLYVLHNSFPMQQHSLFGRTLIPCVNGITYLGLPPQSRGME